MVISAHLEQVLFISVLDQPDASFDSIGDVFECSGPILLSNLNPGDTTGLWILFPRYTYATSIQ